MRSSRAPVPRISLLPSCACRGTDRLEEAGHVERVADPADRRAWRLRVTDKAKPLVAKLRALGRELVEEVFAGIGALIAR